jgi:predicted O-methyltransferase YrrM
MALSGCPQEAHVGHDAVGDVAQQRGPYTFSRDWFSHQKADVHRVVAQHTREPATYLEIGVNEGVAFFWMMDTVLRHPESRGIGVATQWTGSSQKQLFENLSKNARPWRLELRRGTSRQAVARTQAPRSVDVVFVRGGRSAPDVSRDLVHGWEALKPGGLMLVDDYRYRPDWPTELRPTLAVDSFISAFRQQLDVLERGTFVAFKKREGPCETCTQWRGYRFDWSTRTLTNVGNGQRVDLTREELQLVERIFRASPFGEPSPIVTAYIAKQAPYRALARRLGWAPGGG